MRRVLVVLILALGLSVAPAQENGGERLIINLSSASFKEREEAMRALKDRPELAPALRKALSIADAETQRRVRAILDHFDQKRVTELQSAAKEGRVNDLIRSLSSWPEGRYDAETWRTLENFARAVSELHRKAGGKNNRLLTLWDEEPIVIAAGRITENRQIGEGWVHFIRAEEADLDYLSVVGRKPKARLTSRVVVVCSKSVRMTCGPTGPVLVLAGGNVRLRGEPTSDVLVVSGGDVTLDDGSSNSVIIARGKVTLGDFTVNCRISASSVVHEKKFARDCIITENDPNPLGFIRWSDAPKEKEKAAPKSK